MKMQKENEKGMTMTMTNVLFLHAIIKSQQHAQ